MADQWWDSTSHRSHGASACSAAAPPPLTVSGGRVACGGWTASPTAAAAESTSSVTFQDPYRSSTHQQQPLSEAASSLGDPHMADWTQAFLSGRSDTSFQAVLQEQSPAMNDPLISRDDMSAGFLVDLDHQQAQLAPSPYGTEPSQALLDDTAAVHNISMYGDSEASSVSCDATAASMQFPSQLLKTSVPAASSTPMQGVGVGSPMQYLSAGSYLPFGGPQPSHLLLQALQAANKPNSRSSNANSPTVKDDCSPPQPPATRKSVSEPAAAAKRPRIEAPSPLPTFKVRKEKLGDRITALQQLVSPFGKTDTASVLHEAIEYIKFLHDQVASLSYPYLKNEVPMKQFQQKGSEDSKDDNGDSKQDLRSRGLCLVPVGSTYTVAADTPEFWHPTFGGTFRW